MNKDWFESYFKEQWIETKDCIIDFNKYEPVSTANSLHIYEERYMIDEKEYRLLYVIGDTSNTPMIEIKKNEMEANNSKTEIEDLAWQLFQDISGLRFKAGMTAETKKKVTDMPEYQQYLKRAEKVYLKRLAKREKAALKKKYPVIDVPASGKSRWMGGAYTLCFVYSKFDGNFVLKGYSAEVQEYLKKNYTHYFYNLSLWSHGLNRDIWGFWKDDVGIFKPHKDSKIFTGNDRWKFCVRTYSDYYKGEKDEKKMYFKRLPKRWIPEFDNL